MERIIKFRQYNHYGSMNYEPDVPVTEDSSINDIFNIGNIYMQFTGLVDKNGKDIYEGDVLEYEEPTLLYPSRNYVKKTCVVFWDNDNGRFSTGHSNFDWVTTACIIGNIYQNPELLK